MFAYRLLLGLALAGIVVVAYQTRDPFPTAESEPSAPELRASPRAPAASPLPPVDQLAGARGAADQPRTTGEAPASPAMIEPPSVVLKPVVRELYAKAIESRRAEVIARTQLEPVARALFAQGRYKEALDAYTRWNPTHWCGNCRMWLYEHRFYRIALCHLHLGDYAAAAGVCLGAAELSEWDGGGGLFLVRLYDEAGQLDDLNSLLDAIEKRLIERHPKPWPLTPGDRARLLDPVGTQSVRSYLREPYPNRLPPWPGGVPKPKPGSLPKTLPK